MAALNKDIAIPNKPNTNKYHKIDTFDPFFSSSLQLNSSRQFNKTLIVPDRCYCAFVFLAGGSGGGGVGAIGGGTSKGGGAGAAGELVYAAYNVMPGDQLVCKIGAGGISPSIGSNLTDGGNGQISEMSIVSSVYNYGSMVLRASYGNGGYGNTAGKNSYIGGSITSAKNESKVLADGKITGIVNNKRAGSNGDVYVIAPAGYISYDLITIDDIAHAIGAGGADGGQNSMDADDPVRYPIDKGQDGSINIGYIYDLNMQNSAIFFNPGQYEIHVPPGVSSIRYNMIGGGGLGGSSNYYVDRSRRNQVTKIATGGGGSSGEYLTNTIYVNTNDIIKIVVGEITNESYIETNTTKIVARSGLNGNNYNSHDDVNGGESVYHGLGGESVNGGPGAGENGFHVTVTYANPYNYHAKGGVVENNIYKGSGTNSYYKNDPDYNFESLKLPHSGSVSLYYNQPAQNVSYSLIGQVNNNTIPDNTLGLATITVFAIPRLNDLLILEKSSTFKFDISFAKVEGRLKLLNIGALSKILHDNSMLQDINIESIIDNKHNIVFHVRNLLDKYKITIKHSISYST